MGSMCVRHVQVDCSEGCGRTMVQCCWSSAQESKIAAYTYWTALAWMWQTAHGSISHACAPLAHALCGGGVGRRGGVGLDMTMGISSAEVTVAATALTARRA